MIMRAVVGISWFTWKSSRKLTEVVVKLCLVFKNEFDQPRFHFEFDSSAINKKLKGQYHAIFSNTLKIEKTLFG